MGIDTTSDWIGFLLLAHVIVGLGVAVIVGKIAHNKNRDVFGWAFAGLLFGLIVLLLIVVVPEAAPVPQGMTSVTCPRCNAKQNVDKAALSYDCWQCHLDVPLAVGK